MLYELRRGQELDELLRVVTAGKAVYTPVRGPEGRLSLSRADAWDPARHTPGAYRTTEPVKELFLPPRERVGLYEPSGPADGPIDRVVVGVKGCDLSSLRIHDHVFLETEPRDPFYGQARHRTLIVSCDCTDCLDVCFCTAVDEEPYPETGFDLNLSPLADGCVVEAGTERGIAALEGAQHLLQPAGEETLELRRAARERMHARVTERAAEKGLRPGLDYAAAVRGTFDAGLWQDFAEDCVECGACNFICCTCHCFQLADGNGDGPVRTKQWDSCLFRNFGAEAGGGNPRARRAARLRNRFDKKFVYFREVLGTWGCDGCGRCVEACTGGIDIRDVLKRAIDGLQSVRAGSG